jgi:hypothetical protein
MEVYQHVGEADCCYVRWGGKLYEVDESGWSLVEPEDGVQQEVYNEIVLDGAQAIWLGNLTWEVAKQVMELMKQEKGGRR